MPPTRVAVLHPHLAVVLVDDLVGAADRVRLLRTEGRTTQRPPSIRRR